MVRCQSVRTEDLFALEGRSRMCMPERHRDPHWTLLELVVEVKRVPLRIDGIHVPLPQRLSPSNPLFEEIIRRHDVAMNEKRPSYRDPVSALSVFTAHFLADRGYCCESGCRHCPYVVPSKEYRSTE
ncbi:MAG: DUF5522 domain-containing protein [Actinomycetota bacterium]